MRGVGLGVEGEVLGKVVGAPRAGGSVSVVADALPRRVSLLTAGCLD